MEGIQKKIAVLNDLSGYGRCSLTAAMPVISALKVQCCPVVTAVLSNHAGYPRHTWSRGGRWDLRWTES